jgi:hypothetical protein
MGDDVIHCSHNTGYWRIIGATARKVKNDRVVYFAKSFDTIIRLIYI